MAPLVAEQSIKCALPRSPVTDPIDDAAPTLLVRQRGAGDAKVAADVRVQRFLQVVQVDVLQARADAVSGVR
jgi:hypothetical protein